MFDPKLIAILEYLQPFGLENKQILNDLIDRLFPLPKDAPEFEFNNQRNYLNRFLERINKIDSPYGSQAKEGYIKFDAVLLNNINDFRSLPDKWFNVQFKASITEEGLSELARKKEFNEQSLVNQSIIETNNSVKENNQRMVEIMSQQNEINSTIASNSGVQATASGKQTKIFKWTACFAFGAMSIAGANLLRDIHKDNQSQLIKSKD